MDKFLKRTWAEIDLDAARDNYRAIRACMGHGVKMCCVVKAGAYGHGARQLSKLYETLGAEWLAVSNLDEAAQIRRAGVRLPILILGYTPPHMAGELSAQHIAQTILSEQYAIELDREALRAGVTVQVHIKLDTGMTRVGFVYQDPKRDSAALEAIARVCSLRGLVPEGIFTHFAVADAGPAGEDMTRQQYDCFTSAIDRLEGQGIRFQLRHCCNSAGMVEYPAFQLDMCRPGIILYGLQPSSAVRNKLALTPVMQLKSVVSLVKEVPAGTKISYGSTFTTQRTTRVATVPIGYADGYPRLLSGKGRVLVRGQYAPILGRVCMDQLMVDVTDVPGVQEEDLVTLIGCDGGQYISANDLAAYIGTIGYEIVCGVSKRVPRVYYQGGEEVAAVNLLA